MLTISSDSSQRHPTKVSRREMLRIGTLGLSGLGLADLLKTRASAGTGAVRDKAVVLLFLGGGPSHIETFNPNCDQPAPYCSLTGDVATDVPGIRFGGTFPQLATVADKMSIVRSFRHGNSNHSAAVPLVLSGGHVFSGGMNAAYARLRGVNHPATGMPTTSLLVADEIGRFANPKKRIVSGSQPGSMGAAYAPFDPSGNGPALANMSLNVPTARFDDRRALLTRLDSLRRQAEADGMLEGVDRFRQQAFDLILGGAAAAFDLSQEDRRTINRYDTSMFRVGEKKEDIRNCTLGKQLLLARRLVEAGCGFVTVGNAGWDMHASSGNNNMTLPEGMEMLGRPLDKAVSAFIEDIHQRGLSEKVLLVITGEFGRTPKVNKNSGRDHWGNLCTLAFSGGGLPMGQTIGTSARHNDVPESEPIGPQNLMSTLMHLLFDVGQLRVTRGVPREMLAAIESHRPIAELV